MDDGFIAKPRLKFSRGQTGNAEVCFSLQRPPAVSMMEVEGTSDMEARAIAASLLWLTLAVLPATGNAGEFTIDLEIKSGQASQRAHAEEIFGRDKPKPRAVLAVKAGSTVTVKWVLRNTAKKTTFKDVLVHFFVVKEKEIGQRAVPKLDPRQVVIETGQTADFKPKDTAKGEFSFAIDQAGSYLLRLETIGAAATRDDNEYFAAIDVRVKLTGPSRKDVK
jgi:hypothetical protein